MQQYGTDMERVATLIDSYREEIGGANSKNVKALHDYIEAEERRQNSVIEERIANGEDVPFFETVVKHPIELENKIKVNEQLLGHFYLTSAGNEADISVLTQLLADYYDDSFFTTEEESFLTLHFVEVVNYIIETSYLIFQEYSDGKEVHLLPAEILELVATEFVVPDGTTIYNPFSGFAQFAKIFNRDMFVCEESYTLGWERKHKDDANWLWAWMRVALYANNRNAKVVDNCEVQDSYDYAISYMPYTTTDFFINPNEDTYKSVIENKCDAAISSKLELVYQKLSNKGKMLLIIPEFLMWKNGKNYPMGDLWKQMISEGSLAKIIQLPSTCNGLNYNFCIVIIEKGRQTSDVIMTDARFAAKKSELRIVELEDYLDVIRKNEQKSSEETLPSGYRSVFINGKEKMAEEYDVPFFQTVNLELISAMKLNNGKEPNTGLRKLVTINKKNLNLNLLLPQVYVLQKPQDVEDSIPLSNLCSFVSTVIKDLDFDLPLDTPWIKVDNLTYTCQGAINCSKVAKAKCPNNPPHTDDYSFDSNGKLSEGYPWYQRKPIGRRVLEYRKCTYLDGMRDAVLIKIDMNGNPFAIFASEGKSVAVDKSIMAFCPNDGVSIYTLAAILKMPIVYNQIVSYEKFGIPDHLEDIKVPFDKWLIDDEVSRLINEERTTLTLTKVNEDIKKSVRMRKHALTQSMSSLQAVFNALNAYRIRKGGKMIDEEIMSRVKGTTVHEAFEYLSHNIKGIMPVLEHIADVDYSFGDPEWIEPESFIGDYISKNEKGWITFNPIITWEEGDNKAKDNIIDPSTGMILFRKGEAFCLFLFPKAALEKILDNIISNAQSHGFDKSRNDYHIKFSWYAKDKAIKLLVENNGSPIPDDRDPASLREYGVSTALHSDGHNGIGCNEIDDIMQRYDGKIEIISSPQEEYTVKYILTFYRSNSVN